MHSPSRRAFLRWRKLPQTPWEQFCQRLRRTVTGEFVELQGSDIPAGRLIAQHTADIHHVRALCDEYGVVLGLDELALSVRQPTRPVVWVRPGKGLARFRRLDPKGSTWFVQPGCTMGELADAGLHKLAPLPSDMTVAAWLADRQYADYPGGQTVRSGLKHASLLLGDGHVVTFGPFAAKNTMPLDGLRLQTLVPGLFRLAMRADGSGCAQADLWPLRYRLDALMSLNRHTHNLAHICLGQGGELGWLEWAVIDADELYIGHDRDMQVSNHRTAHDNDEQALIELDAGVKMLFDPHGVFPDGGLS